MEEKEDSYLFITNLRHSTGNEQSIYVRAHIHAHALLLRIGKERNRAWKGIRRF